MHLGTVVHGTAPQCKLHVLTVGQQRAAYSTILSATLPTLHFPQGAATHDWLVCAQRP